MFSDCRRPCDECSPTHWRDCRTHHKNTTISQVPVQCVTQQREIQLCCFAVVALDLRPPCELSTSDCSCSDSHAFIAQDFSTYSVSVVEYRQGGLLQVAQPIGTLDGQVDTNYLCADSA